MTMTIPTIPAMPAGYIATSTDMNNLSACCTFLLTKPIVRVHDSAGGQSIGTSFGAISFATKDFDTDTMWASGQATRLTVQTPGWYKVRYAITSGTTTAVISTGVFGQTGSNNPQGSGIVNGPFWGGYSVGISSDPQGTGSSGLWPFYLYAGDWLTVQAQSSTPATNTTVTTNAASFFSMEYVSI